MSGHSKWSQIKRKKEASDAKKGQLFTKLGRELSIAARQGGGDPESNFALRLVMDKAKAANMPKDNIERAIKRGTGELKGEALEEIVYEGYGPEGTALMVQVLTDNRNRVAADIRRVFSRNGGNMGTAGCVAWLFEHRGVITLEADKQNPDDLALIAIDAGAEDVRVDDGFVEVLTKPQDFPWVKSALEKRHLPIASAELSMVPKTYVRVNEKATLQTMHLIEALEELEDVRQVYTNMDIPEELVTQYESSATR